jgi:hypothetical protein
MPSDTHLHSKDKEHHQDTKAPRKAKATIHAVLGVLVVRSPFFIELSAIWYKTPFTVGLHRF